MKKAVPKRTRRVNPLIQPIISKVKNSFSGSVATLNEEEIITVLKYLLLLSEQQEERLYELEKKSR